MTFTNDAEEPARIMGDVTRAFPVSVALTATLGAILAEAWRACARKA